jgi:hypothetical protein
MIGPAMSMHEDTTDAGQLDAGAAELSGLRAVGQALRNVPILADAACALSASPWHNTRAAPSAEQELLMKAYYLLAPLGAIALAGCTVYRPVALEPAVVTPSVAVAPTYVTPPNAVVLGAGSATTTDPALLDSDHDGYNNSVDRYPNDPRWH